MTKKLKPPALLEFEKHIGKRTFNLGDIVYVWHHNYRWQEEAEPGQPDKEYKVYQARIIGMWHFVGYDSPFQKSVKPKLCHSFEYALQLGGNAGRVNFMQEKIFRTKEDAFFRMPYAPLEP